MYIKKKQTKTTIDKGGLIGFHDDATASGRKMKRGEEGKTKGKNLRMHLADDKSELKI